jgi:hypothetical protein
MKPKHGPGTVLPPPATFQGARQWIWGREQDMAKDAWHVVLGLRTFGPSVGSESSLPWGISTNSCSAWSMWTAAPAAGALLRALCDVWGRTGTRELRSAGGAGFLLCHAWHAWWWPRAARSAGPFARTASPAAPPPSRRASCGRSMASSSSYSHLRSSTLACRCSFPAAFQAPPASVPPAATSLSLGRDRKSWLRRLGLQRHSPADRLQPKTAPQQLPNKK